MAKTEVGLSVDVEFQSVGQMRKAIKEATGDLIAMSEKFGTASKEATAAAKRVAELKDRLGDAKALADTFNPDKKFVALGGAIQGAVSGFSALQGAMGLFGDKNKEVEQLMLKVQSAMALQQGISGIAGAMDSMKMFAAVIRTQVVAAFTTLRGAMSAVGIGLLTSAIAYLVENFDKVKKAIYDTFPALKGLFDNMDRIKQIAMGVGNAIMQFLAAPISAIVKVIKGDFSGAMDALKQGVSFTKNFREGEQKEIKEQADEREKVRQDELKKQAEANKKKLEEQKRAAAELKKERENAEKEYTKFIESENERRAKLRMDDFDKERLEIEKRYKEQLAIAKKYGFDTSEIERLRFQDTKDLINKTTEENKTGLEKQLGDFKAMVPMRADIVTSITAKDIEGSKERTFWGKMEAEQKVQFAQTIGNAMGALSELIGKQTAAGKALGIAQATINTWIGVSEILRAKSVLPEPAGTIAKFVNVAAVIASGINAVKNIVKVQVPGGGGGGSMPSPSPGGTTAPIPAALPATATAQMVNAQAINNLGNQATRAYVLNSDIQNNDQRNAYLQRNASIG